MCQAFLSPDSSVQHEGSVRANTVQMQPNRTQELQRSGLAGLMLSLFGYRHRAAVLSENGISLRARLPESVPFEQLARPLSVKKNLGFWTVVFPLKGQNEVHLVGIAARLLERIPASQPTMRAHPTLAPSRARLSARRRISVSCIYAVAAGASGVCVSDHRNSVPSDHIRGPCGAKDEFLLAAIAQNLRKLAKLFPAPQQPRNA